VSHADGAPHEHHRGDPVFRSDASAERSGEGLENDECDAEQGDGIADVVGFEVGVFDEGCGRYIAYVCLENTVSRTLIRLGDLE